MFLNVLKKFFGSTDERFLKKLEPIVERINAFEPAIEKLSEEALKAKTVEFKERLSKGENLDDLLPEAFAVVREGAKRSLGLRPYDVQMTGGIVLHKGMVAEMATGEGKTLVATLPVYLNALTGKGVHVVTVNDYLASRDSQWMGQLYNYLGLSVDCIAYFTADCRYVQAELIHTGAVKHDFNLGKAFLYVGHRFRHKLTSLFLEKFNNIF